jgi:hypothetical protein
MNTLAKTSNALLTAKAESKHQSATTQLWETMETNRFGLIVVILLIIGCLGGIAAAFGAGDSTLQIALTAFPTILSLALVLGVAPMKAIFSLSLVAVILDLLVLIF